MKVSLSRLFHHVIIFSLEKMLSQVSAESYFLHLKTTTSIQYNKLLESWLTSELIYFTELTTEKSGKKN